MSYSICLRCKDMVSQYEKYCDVCAKQYRQDATFWKDSQMYGLFSEAKAGARLEELQKDEIEVKW